MCRRGFRNALAAVLACGLPVGMTAPAARAQAPPSDLARAIGNLGDFDHGVRVAASRVVRRTDVAVAVPALIEAARSHEDSYVQFRAAALLAGFGDERSRAFFREALDSPNDRVRRRGVRRGRAAARSGARAAAAGGARVGDVGVRAAGAHPRPRGPR